MPLEMAAPLLPLAVAGGAVAQGVITSAYNAFQADRNRNFQERMSNTSHQREVADLRAAGLNPILSAKHGGASTPSGATAVATAPDVVNSALSAATTAAQIKDLNSAAALKDAQAGDILRTQMHRLGVMSASIDKLIMDGEVSVEQRAKLREEQALIKQQREKLSLDIAHSSYDLSRSKNESEFQETFGGDLVPWIKFFKSMVK